MSIRRTYEPALTGLRGIAALSIFVAHSRIPAEIETSQPLVVQLRNAVWFGVPVFFVLSGYLITWLALHERETFGGLDLSRFVKRRVLRIFPLYFTVSAALFAAWFLPHSSSIAGAPQAILPIATFTANFFLTTGFPGVFLGSMIPLWTVSAEEQFYFFWGFILRYASRRNLSLLALSGVILSLIVRFAVNPYSTFLLYRINPGVSLGSLMLGCLVALNRDAILNRRPKRWDLIVCGILAAVAAYTWPQAEMTFDAGLLVCSVDIAAALIVLEATQHGLVQRALSMRILVRAGDISYAFYLIHLAIIWSYGKIEQQSPALLRLSHNAPWISLLLAFVLTLLMTWLAAEALTRMEAPFMRMRHALRRDDSTIRNSAGSAVQAVPIAS